MNNQELNKINQLIRDMKREQSSMKRQEMIIAVLELMIKIQ
jgi:hypothetical protein|tara:strand:+ start:251 stop:373 length:123 start_codon:yes stop_codon:yes gene_type:complete